MSAKEEFEAELTKRINEWARANRVRLADYDSAGRFAEWSKPEYVDDLVGQLVVDWSVDKTMFDLDKDKILRDPTAPLRHAGDDYDPKQATKVVVYEISTAHRPLTEAEQAKLDADNAHWEARRVQQSAIYRWELSDQSDPPPDGTTIGTLLNHRVWWLTKDKRAIRIADMEPSHRANLLRLMLRNADAWKEVELHRFLMQGAPDDVTSSAEYMTGKDWLAEKELFQALRKLVLTDQVGAGTCQIEWFDDKPLGCVLGADGHVCVLGARHEKRCSCRCGARPAKGSTAFHKARAVRQKALADEMLPQIFPEPPPSTGKTVRQETVQRFMDLGATRRFEEDKNTGDDLTAEDIH